MHSPFSPLLVVLTQRKPVSRWEFAGAVPSPSRVRRATERCRLPPPQRPTRPPQTPAGRAGDTYLMVFPGSASMTQVQCRLLS